MRGDEVIARKCSPPIALGARHKYGLAPFVGEPIERLLDCEIGAPLSPASARVCKHVGPPFVAGRLLRVRPRATFDCITRLGHRTDQPCDIGLAHVKQGEVWAHATPYRLSRRSNGSLRANAVGRWDDVRRSSLSRTWEERPRQSRRKAPCDAT